MPNFVKNPSFFTACLISLILGGIGTLAFAPFDFWVVAFISAFGLIWAATLPTRKTALWATLAWSIGYFGIGVSWIHVSMIQFGGVPLIVSYLAVFLLACYLALYNLLFAWGIHQFKLQNPFVLASLFTLTEYLRGVVFTGFPWLQLGYSQIDSPFANIAPILGVEGITFFVISVAVYLVKFVQQDKLEIKPLATFVLILAVGFATKFTDFSQKDEQKSPLTISLVQGNIEQKMKWDPAHFNYSVQTYSDLIRPLLGQSNVIILPESAIPALENQITPLLEAMQNASQQSQSEIIIGTLFQDQKNELFNSALLLNEHPYNAEQASRYKKHHLVPFGEYVPFGSLLDWMREVFVLPINLSQGDFIQPALQAKNTRFNLAICYEIIFGDQVQQNQKAHNADYLLTITNDAWFGTSSGPWQHFQMARMRALELGKPLLRAANTGITAIVDENGKVNQQLPQFEKGVLTAQVSPTISKTPFSLWGNSVLYSLSALIVALAVIRRKQR